VQKAVSQRYSDLVIPKNRLSASLNDLIFSRSRALWVAMELLLTFIFFMIGVWQSPHGKWNQWSPSIAYLAIAFALTHTGLSFGMGQFERVRRLSLSKIASNGLYACLIASLVAAALTYFLYYNVFGRLVVLWGAAAAYMGITLFRLTLAGIFSLCPYRFTILGSSAVSEQVICFLQTPNQRESKYFQYVPAPPDLSKLWGMVDHHGVNDIVICKDSLPESDMLNFLLGAMERKIRIVSDIQFYSDLVECLPLSAIDPNYIAQHNLNLRSLIKDIGKRTLDIVVSGVALIACSPILLAICVIIKVSSPGRVLFIQPRQGRFGRNFKMLKFRTMHESQSRLDASGGFTRSGDDRISWIGRILRPLHLDELPQLFNILKGDMSIVGPRPEALSFAQRMSKEIPLYRLRYVVRPGLTGHAQILAGYMMDTVEDTQKKLSYDLYYIVNHNLRLDFSIMLRTCFVVLKKLV
jgi:lipopolysaccharide/colanic/teichoic acid biosynthesis glycosyltransferase